MVHINKEGELVDIGGSLTDIAGDITNLISTAITTMEQEGFEAEEIGEYLSTILRATIICCESEEIERGVKMACSNTSCYDGSDTKEMLFEIEHMTAYNESGITS